MVNDCSTIKLCAVQGWWKKYFIDWMDRKVDKHAVFACARQCKSLICHSVSNTEPTMCGNDWIVDDYSVPQLKHHSTSSLLYNSTAFVLLLLLLWLWIHICGWWWRWWWDTNGYLHMHAQCICASCCYVMSFYKLTINTFTQLLYAHFIILSCCHRCTLCESSSKPFMFIPWSQFTIFAHSIQRRCTQILIQYSNEQQRQQ